MQDLADALAEAAAAIDHHDDLDETLDAIVRAAVASVPGFDHVGISVRHADGRIDTQAGTGQPVWALDELQYELDEGPCVDAIREDHTVVVENVVHEPRWPEYAERAAALGVRSQLAVRLYADDHTLGGLNLYSLSSDDVHPEAVHTAELFATHAAIALGHAQRTAQLGQGMASRKLIGQAIGILMERHEIDEDRALQFLMRTSSTSNVKVATVAEEIVTGANDRCRRA